MNKAQLLDFLTKREEEKIKSFHDSLDDFIGDTHIDYNEKREKDDHSHHHQASIKGNVVHAHGHSHHEHLEAFRRLNTAESFEVEEGALLQVNDRYLYIAVAEDVVEFEGKKVTLISKDAPLYQCLKGKKAGDRCSYNNHDFTIKNIY